MEEEAVRNSPAGSKDIHALECGLSCPEGDLEIQQSQKESPSAPTLLFTLYLGAPGILLLGEQPKAWDVCHVLGSPDLLPCAASSGRGGHPLHTHLLETWHEELGGF